MGFRMYKIASYDYFFQKNIYCYIFIKLQARILFSPKTKDAVDVRVTLCVFINMVYG